MGSGEVAQEEDADTTEKGIQDILILDDEQKRRIQKRRRGASSTERRNYPSIMEEKVRVF